ncbi:hypothetical protein L210DRAFT_3645388 [Boletus edulis BED1]|uniref:Uncharacterized protein n=1 Tax=Boletus edulis BED1 TaxID=1328754 RepID=A0AAD4GFR8_BOLED|nr:hypothetical protein L210DRAFT_3645388 [Boletus edulis BED1]
MKAASRNDKPVVNAPVADNAGSRVLPLSDLPDPSNCYAGLIQAHAPLVRMKVVIPDVLDSQGRAITPGECESKIKDGQVIEVEVYLKLWNQQRQQSLSNLPAGPKVHEMSTLPFIYKSSYYATQPSNKKRPNPAGDDDSRENNEASPSK